MFSILASSLELPGCSTQRAGYRSFCLFSFYASTCQTFCRFVDLVLEGISMINDDSHGNKYIITMARFRPDFLALATERTSTWGQRIFIIGTLTRTLLLRISRVRWRLDGRCNFSQTNCDEHKKWLKNKRSALTSWNPSNPGTFGSNRKYGFLPLHQRQ